MEYFKSLPVHIELDILTRLPAESVLECKVVSKSWNNLISHEPSFSKMHQYHLNHPSTVAHDSGKLSYIALTGSGFRRFFYFEYNENHESAAPIERIRRIILPPTWGQPTFVGSCNGLICLARPTNLSAPIYVFNPITREYIRLPEIERAYDINNNNHWTSGFGYVSSTNEYKVLRLYEETDELVDVHIYTLGSGSGWRSLGRFNSPFIRYHQPYQAGIFANEALYWLDFELNRIVTFDLVAEKFCEYLSPPPLPEYSNWRDDSHRIGVSDGCLFFAARLIVRGYGHNEIWILKKKSVDYRMKEEEEEKDQSLVWSKESTVSGRKVAAVIKSDGVLTYGSYYLNIYDTKTSTSKRLVEFQEEVCDVFPHKNTLVSLKDLGEEDTKIMESTDIHWTRAHDRPFIFRRITKKLVQK